MMNLLVQYNNNQNKNNKSMSSRSKHRQPLDTHTQLMDAERILINPLNRSLSKQQFTFPKAQRWQRTQTTVQNYRFYDIPTSKSKIATSIGNAKRSSMNRLEVGTAPAPNQYTYIVEGQFGKSQRKTSKGHAFGLGRDDLKNGHFLRLKSEGPSPGTYEISKNQRKDISFPRERKEKKEGPPSDVGPGAYKVSTSLEENKQILSTQHRYASPKIHDIKLDSRRKIQKPVPPLYNPRMTTKGQNLDSQKYKGFRIGTSKRLNHMPTGQFPGPGRYKIFSEFISKGKS